MTKFRVLVVAVVAAIPTFLFASPASATCQTNPDLGDVCTVVNEFCTSKIGQHVCRD